MLDEFNEGSIIALAFVIASWLRYCWKHVWRHGISRAPRRARQMIEDAEMQYARDEISVERLEELIWNALLIEDGRSKTTPTTTSAYSILKDQYGMMQIMPSEEDRRQRIEFIKRLSERQLEEFEFHVDQRIAPIPVFRSGGTTGVRK